MKNKTLLESPKGFFNDSMNLYTFAIEQSSQIHRPFLILSFLMLLSSPLWTEEVNEYDPIYAGTQLAFYPDNVAPGHLSTQPFLFATRKYGIYDNHWSSSRKHYIDQLNLLLALETGITNTLDITLLLNGMYASVEKQHSWLYGDTKAYLGWQLFHDEKETWTPDLRFLLGESFPTGKYRHLNSLKEGSDVSGSGSYATTFLVVLAKTFYALPKHPFNFNLNLFYILSSKTDVEGFNLYGGVSTTKGKIKPGDEFIVNLATQYSLTRLCVLGIDIRYDHQNRCSFSGKKGRLSNGEPAKGGLASSELFSLAPCIEYSWSTNLSVAGGAWFTVAGRNSTNFLSAVANVYYYF